MILDLFSDQSDDKVQLANGAYCLNKFALAEADQICNILLDHFLDHPPQQMMTPMGYPMSVRTTSFGQFGWVGSNNGYRYSTYNPNTQQPWADIPILFLDLAKRAAKKAGYEDFVADTCLVNVYNVGNKMGLHQDKDEYDFRQPIVSVSLGLPIIFQLGGLSRSAKTKKVKLHHGDVVVWGGESRMCFHGVLSLKSGSHPVLGQRRINLTFRKAGKI